MGIRRTEFHLQKPRSESTVVRCISPVKAGFRGRALLAFQKNLTMTLEHTVSALRQLALTNQSLGFSKTKGPTFSQKNCSKTTDSETFVQLMQKY